ncbi:MAG: DUF2157 domain-containing protein [Brevinematia bacterium]
MSKKQIILKELKKWLDDELIDQEIYSKLSSQYNVGQWDFAVIIRGCLVIGSIVLGVGIISLLTLILESLYFLAFILTILFILSFVFGVMLTEKKWKIYLPKTGNAIIVVACLILCADIFTIAKIIFPQGGNWSILLLINSIIYFFIAYIRKNRVVLVLALIFIASWFGAQTGYVSDWGFYFFGMSYPMRFAVVSPILILIGYLHKKILPEVYFNFSKVYYVMGALYTNLSLWILSIIGNSDRILSSSENYHLELLFYSIIWLMFNIIIFIIGAKYKNKIFTGFAIVFVILNLYTRYFEYFWDKFDKSLFFIILGSITITIGIFLEKKLKKLNKS